MTEGWEIFFAGIACTSASSLVIFAWKSPENYLRAAIPLTMIGIIGAILGVYGGQLLQAFFEQVRPLLDRDLAKIEALNAAYSTMSMWQARLVSWSMYFLGFLLLLSLLPIFSGSKKAP